jgi:hypothetical protein
VILQFSQENKCSLFWEKSTIKNKGKEHAGKTQTRNSSVNTESDGDDDTESDDAGTKEPNKLQVCSFSICCYM